MLHTRRKGSRFALPKRCSIVSSRGTAFTTDFVKFCDNGMSVYCMSLLAHCKCQKKWFCLSILSHAPVFFKSMLVVNLVSLVLFSK